MSEDCPKCGKPKTVPDIPENMQGDIYGFSLVCECDNASLAICPCRKCGRNAKVDKDWEYSIECSDEECNNAVLGEKTLIDAIRQWNNHNKD